MEAETIESTLARLQQDLPKTWEQFEKRQAWISSELEAVIQACEADAASEADATFETDATSESDATSETDAAWDATRWNQISARSMAHVAQKDLELLEEDRQLLQKMKIVTEEAASSLKGLTLGDNGLEQAESSRTKGKGKSRISDRTVCPVCHEVKHFFDIAQVSCGHVYCRDCINVMFNLATTSEILFPPKCCLQEFEVDQVLEFLSPDLFDRFSKKAVEFGTVDRTYCVSTSCSEFIPPSDIQNNLATCSACFRRTCAVCKNEAHHGDCPSDTALQQVLDVATANGWQRCYSCGRMLERVNGCEHMTCWCKAQFCYVCARPWKTCKCDELLERVDAAAWNPPLQIPEAAPAPAPAPTPTIVTAQAPATVLASKSALKSVLGSTLKRALALVPSRAPVQTTTPSPAPGLSLGPILPEQVLPASIMHRPHQVEAPPANESISRPPSPEAEVQIAAHIDTIMNAPHEDHPCTHQKRWRRMAWVHRCDLCFLNLPLYIYEFVECRILVCRRCKLNRL